MDLPPHLHSSELDTRLPDLMVEAHYWRPGYLTKTARLCPEPRLCIRNRTTSATYDRFDDSTCDSTRGVAGAYCQLCMDQTHFYDQQVRRCTKCFVDKSIPSVALLVAAIIMVLFMTLAPMPRCLSRLSKLRRTVSLYAARLSFRSKLRETIAFVQVVTQISQVYDLRFPPEYSTLLDILSVLNLSFVSWLPTIRLFCLGLSSLRARLILATWLPLTAAIAAPILSILISGDALPSIPYVVGGTFLAFPAISSYGFRSLGACDCFEFVGGSHVCFLPEDYEVRCHGEGLQGAPQDVVLAAWGAVLVWAVAVPLFYGLLVVAAHCNWFPTQRIGIDSSELRKHILFLTSGYRPGAVGWQLVLVAQRIILTGFFALYRPGSESQLAAASLVVLLFFAVQARVEPHRARGDNLFSHLTSCMLLLVFLFSSALQATALNPTIELNAYLMAAVLFAATLLVIVVAVALFLQEAYSSRQLLEEANLRQLPSLELRGTTRIVTSKKLIL